MIEETDVFKIVKEDILRITAESSREVSVNSFKTKINVSSSLISSALKALERENLIKIEGHSINLTKDGQKKSKNILRKHLILESYFQKNLDEGSAHSKAHILEHYVSEEVLKNIKMIDTLKDNCIPSTKFTLHKEGMIADMNINQDDQGLFERLVSMGIIPGERIEILSIIPGIFIVQIENKKFALDEEIMKAIKILEI